MSYCTRWDIGNATGKTTRLIERAYAENLYIVVPDMKRAQIIKKMAQDMGKQILYPVTVDELPFKMLGNAYCMTHDGVLVDDVDAVLERIIGMPVLGAASRGLLGGDAE